MKLTYDEEVDAAYLYIFDDSITVEKTIICDHDAVGGDIHLDFDKESRLVGIEVLNAKQMLPSELFNKENK